MTFLARYKFLLLIPSLLLAVGGLVAYNLSQSPRDANGKSPCRFCSSCCDAPSRSQLSFTAAQNSDAAATLNPDVATFAGTAARNMANTSAKGIPTEWDKKSKKNIKWIADLGSVSYGGPVISGGIVYVGTNNKKPRDPAVKGIKAVLMAFSEADGTFLWQNVHDIPTELSEIRNGDLGQLGTPTVEGDLLWYVTPGAEVHCADAKTGKKIWSLDMHKELKVHPFHCSNCSPAVLGDLLFLVTGNGADEDGSSVPEPKAPSFLALNKKTGKIAWKSDAPGDNILEGQWSNPAIAVIAGKPQVIFPGGDAYLYSFEPETGKLLWKFNCAPEQKKGDNPISYMIGSPTVYKDRIYVGLGIYPDHASPPRSTYVVCVDATKEGDVSPKNLDAKDPKNKDSALVWAFGGKINPPPKITERQVYFGPTMSTCAIADDLLYISEMAGYLHCLDAKTGQRHWVFDLKGAVWGSPYLADGRVYMVNEDGYFYIFKHAKEMSEPQEVEMDELIQNTPVVANNVLYMMTKNKLYAIAQGK